MNATFNKMTVAITVLSYDKANYKAKVKVGIDYKGDGSIEETILHNVYIDGLAIYRFENSNKFELGKTYISTNDSKNYDENPLKIIRSCSLVNGNLIFALKVVNTGKSTRVKYATPKGNIVNSIKFSTLPKEKWLRYSDYYNKNKAIYEKKQAERAV